MTTERLPAPFWFLLVDRLWDLMWRAVTALLVAASITTGVMAGLRICGLIARKLHP